MMGATPADGMPTGLRAWVFTQAALATVGVVALAGSADLRMLARPLPLALVLGIALAEVYSVWDGGRPRNITVTVSELFTGIAFVVLAPGIALLVCVAGSMLIPPLRATVGPLRRVPPRSPLVLLYSVTMPVLRAVAGVAVLTLTGDVLGTAGAAVAGIAALVLADTISTGVVVGLDTGLPFREAVTGDVIIEYLVPFGVGAFGVVLGLVLRGQGVAWLVALALAGLVVAISHAGMTWSRERMRSHVLLDVAESTARAAGHRDVAAELVARVADALHADRVELTDGPPDWAAVRAPIGAHGWIGVAERSIPTQAAFDHRDQELLEEVSTIAVVALDNASLLARLEDEERMRSTLLAAAAHDLRSPLSTTEGALQTMQDAASSLPTAVRDQLLGVATGATRRAGRLVHDLIVLEQQHLAARDTEGGHADVAEVAGAVVAALPPDQAQRCVLDTRAVPPVAMSPVLLERVVDNLVGNALKHTPDGGPVHVRVRSSGDRVVLAVDDRGPGVPPAQRRRILAPFERAVTTAEGYGLGLHIATEFVRRAGGELDITDRTDGDGASFSVRLPPSD